jgi:large subunit ribosomal protein L31e
MGSVLDSPEDIREDKKGSSRKAHSSQEKLAKNQVKGIKMAKKEETKIVLERVYTVPLRKGFLKVPRYMRTQKAARVLRIFLEKNMKSKDIRLGKYVNKLLWEHGIQNPPHHVKVTCIKDDKGVVKVELVGAPKEDKKDEKKKPAKKEVKAEIVKEEKTEAKQEAAFEEKIVAKDESPLEAEVVKETPKKPKKKVVKEEKKAE